MKILVTGGTGYIGSHTCVQLIDKGWQPVILDSLVNSKASVLQRIEQITGHRPAFIEGDVRDSALLEKTLASHGIEAVIHFAGLKAVGESVVQPLRYYDNNVNGSVVLMQAMPDALGPDEAPEPGKAPPPAKARSLAHLPGLDVSGCAPQFTVIAVRHSDLRVIRWRSVAAQGH